MKTSKAEIASSNLVFLRTLVSSPRHRIVFTESVSDLQETKPELFQILISKVRSFDDWTNDNDPYGERDFGRVKVEGIDYFFKIDLYDGPDLEWGFDRDTMEPARCSRVLTIMAASEY